MSDRPHESAPLGGRPIEAVSDGSRTDRNREPRFSAERRLPPWLKKRWPAAGSGCQTTATVEASGVATVCQEARCPNRTECWSHGTVTFMILGRVCTRGCRFCAVESGVPLPPDHDEPRRLAESVGALGARYIVLTSVTRDDLPDEGAGHFAACVRAVREAVTEVQVEVLPSDMHARSECIDEVCRSGPVVYGHNIETVERLTPLIRSKADYRRSLEVLRIARRLHPEIRTKSGLLLGMGESRSEIDACLRDLREAGCDLVAIGQYLQPTPVHQPVARYWTPEEFDEIAGAARSLGFVGVACGPFVRSSYGAAESFAAC